MINFFTMCVWNYALFYNVITDLRATLRRHRLLATDRGAEPVLLLTEEDEDKVTVAHQMTLS